MQCRQLWRKSAQYACMVTQTQGCACREYLDSTVVPVLRDGLRMLVKERPEDPCNYLVDYIKANHP